MHNLGIGVHGGAREELADYVRPRARPRATQTLRTALQRLQEWRIDRVVRKGAADAVVCIQRAGRTVERWRKGKTNRPHMTPPKRIIQGVVHHGALPVLTANEGDRYILPGLRRYMTLDEVADAFAIGAHSSLRRALKGRGARGAISEGNAVHMLGAAMHVGAFKLVLARALELAGVEVGGQRRVRMGDACSGVGTAAEAMEQLTSGQWEYVFAAEQAPTPRMVLETAWGHRGLRRVHGDARTVHAEEKETVDVYVMTPDCYPFSKAGRGRDRSTAAAGVEAMLRYAQMRQPSVVIMENAHELITGAATSVRASGEEIEAAMRRVKGYKWYKQAVCAAEHGGSAMARKRAFWVGVRAAQVARGRGGARKQP